MCGTYRFHQLVTTTLMIPAGIRWGLHLAGGTMPYTLYDCACGLAAAWHRWPTFEGDALIVEDDTFWLPYGPDAVPNLEELRQLRTTLVETMIAMARGRAASGDDYGQDEADGAACRAMANALRAARKDTP
jgi:hypothetical protein